jgi:hypothetical protein
MIDTYPRLSHTSMNLNFAPLAFLLSADFHEKRAVDFHEIIPVFWSRKTFVRLPSSESIGHT